MTLVSTPPVPFARLRAGWASAHAPVAGVPRWARIAAMAVPFTVLPAGLWRIAAFAFHLPILSGNGLDTEAAGGDLPGWVPLEAYVVLLSIVSEVVAFTAVGLVAGWGEVFPRWVPGLRGRRVPITVAVVPGLAGAAILTPMWTASVVNCLVFQKNIQGRPLPDDFPIHFHDWQGVLGAVAYAPLLAWGPLLAAVTLAYWRRRTRAS
ncbi:hypothetical protein [Actinomadura citrea]|jgi:hypothetical protein|uniref:Uncharacterized protein n=1 Tax=Actinomadura citrea TaxID=46158 RepID=A0A7Y9GGP7_9ACTN|nr:hypothetical protein [Actinomadura citrea]NYE16170.1 hypothetical protein [Actinomadura citrea]GGT81567.1 hypothetical protein GCM10010177_45960 [Actinomadura citrea]